MEMKQQQQQQQRTVALRARHSRGAAAGNYSIEENRCHVHCDYRAPEKARAAAVFLTVWLQVAIVGYYQPVSWSNKTDGTFRVDAPAMRDKK